MSEYEPELGQACFGQPWQPMECPNEVKYALESMKLAWYAIRQEEKTNPFSNTGYRYDGKAFKAHAYSWNEDEDQEWNFAWRDVRVSWYRYKYLGRGTTINREMKDEEIAEMLRECMSEILGMQQGDPVAWMTEDGRVALARTKEEAMPSSAKESYNIPLYTGLVPTTGAKPMLDGVTAPVEHGNDSADWRGSNEV